MKLKRPIETYRAMDPRAVVAGSQTQSFTALTDLRHDLLVLAEAIATVRHAIADDLAVALIDSLIGKPG